MTTRKNTVALLLSIICLIAIVGCRRGLPTLLDRPRITQGVILRDVSFYSTSLARQMPYRVFLPANLPAEQKLPVVYLLHGGGSDFRAWSNYSEVSRYAADGLILVMPEGDSSYYVNSVEVKQDKYEDYITKDLIADVEGRFPAMNDPAHRAIAGVSMGGYAAIQYALTRPGLFAFAGALSPAVDVPSRKFSWKHADQWWRFRQIFGPLGSEERESRDPFISVQTANAQSVPYLYVTAGQQEPLRGPIQRFVVQLRKRGIAYEFHTKPGGHDWTEWNAQIPGCFESLLTHLGMK